MEFYINVLISFVKIAKVRDVSPMRGSCFLVLGHFFIGLPIPEENSVQEFFGKN